MKIKQRDIPFFIFYGLLIIWRVLLDSEYAGILNLKAANNLLGIIVILGFFLQILINKITLKRFFILLFLAILTVGIAAKSHIFMILLILVALVSSWNIEFKKIVKFSYIMCISLLVFVVGSSLLGIIPNNVYNTAYASGNQYCMGFNYFTAFPSLVLYIIIMKMYLNKNISYVELFSYIFVFAGLYLIAEVTLNLIIGLVLIIEYLVIVKWKLCNISKRKIYRIALCTAFILIISIVFMAVNFNANNGLIAAINRILNNRLFYSYKGISQYGIHLLGSYIPVTTSVTATSAVEYFYIDIGYIYYILNFGIIGTITIVGALLYILYNAAKRKDKIVFIWSTIVVIECCIGRTLDSIWRNPLLFCAIYYICKVFQKKKKRKIKIKI